MSDERPKKSWREIDKQRDHSQHRREERPDVGARDRGPRSQQSYRSKLDQIFNSGKVGELIAKSALGVPAAAPLSDDSRVKLLRQVHAAEGRDPITQAIDAFLAKYELPDDFDVLTKMVEHRSPIRQREAMEHLNRLLDQQVPKRARALVGQLKMVRDTSEDPELTELAQKLITRLD